MAYGLCPFALLLILFILRTQVFIQAFSQSKDYILYRNANLSRSPLVKPVQSYLFDTLSSPAPSNILVKWGIILFIPSCNLQGEITLPRPDAVGALLFLPGSAEQMVANWARMR